MITSKNKEKQNKTKTPFTFTPSSTVTNFNRNTVAQQPTLWQIIHETFHQKFLNQINEWKKVHENSVEILQEFLSYKLLMSNLNNEENEQQLKMRQCMIELDGYHTKLVECVSKYFYSILLEMKNILKEAQNTVQNHVHSTQQMMEAQNRGQYGFLCSVMDYIKFMNQYVQMYENEYDMKNIIVQSLHEEETIYVLNSYMISWKKQPFRNIKVLKNMEMEQNRDEKMRAKLEMPF